MLPRVLYLLVILFCAASAAQATDHAAPPLKLYCGAVTTELGWSGTLPYTLQICPLNSEGCNAEKRPYSLQPKLDQADSNTHCHFFDRPVKYLIEYNANYTGGRDYVAQELIPIGFDWRGLYPDVWCLEDGTAYFTNIDGKVALRAGYFPRVIRQACGWRDPIDEKLPPPNSDLPPELVGAWVPERKECPGIFDDAARTGDLLWIQPHGIERADGACWLTGLFALTPKLPVDTLCATKKGYKRTSFTFDRIKGDSMRLREGGKRRVTYKRCEKTWLVAPEQRKAADKLKEQTLSFVLELDTQMRSLKSGKTGPIVSQERKIELKVGDDKTLTDRMQIGDSAPPKTFTTRLGEIAIDSDGDRTTWLVDDGKLKRVRERKSYYEILSWPLSADGKSVTCEAKLEFAPTRSDGKLRSVDTDRKEYEVVKAEIKGQRCMKEPLLFAVAAANANGEKTRPLDQCVIPTAERLKDPAKIRYELTVRNQCRFGVIVRVGGDVIDRPYLEDLPGAAGQGGRFQISRSTGFTLTREATAKQFLDAMEFSVLTSDDYIKSCPGIDVEDTEKALTCFGKTYLAKHGEPKRAKPSADADKCIVNKTIVKAGPGAKSSHHLSITNDCPFEPVVAIRGPWLRGGRLITPAPSKGSGNAIGFSWDVNPPAGTTPDELLKQLEFAALSLEEFRRSCDAGVFDTDLELRFQCFAGAYDKKHGKRDWAVPLWAKDGLAAGEEMERQAADKCIKSSMEKTTGGAWRYSLRFENTCEYGLVLRVQQPGTSQEAAALLPDQSARELPVTFDQAVDTEAYLKRLEISVLTLEDYKRTCGEFRDNDEKAALTCFNKAYAASHGEPDWVKDAKTADGCVAADPDIAINACTADIAAGKTDADTLNNRAAAYLQKGQFDLALPDLDKAIERDSKHYGALSNRGIVLMKTKQYRRALEDFTKAIDLAPIPLRPYRQRAEAHAALGEHAKAWKDADQALAIDPKDDKALELRKAAAHEMFGSKLGDMTEFYADSCSQDKDADLRVKACLLLIKEGKVGAEDLALAHVYIGQVAEALSKREFFANRKESAQKNIRSALNQYALAIKADTKNPIGYAEIGKVLIAAKMYDQAEQWLRKGEQAAPASRLICDRLVLLYERKGDSTAKDKQNARCEVLPEENPFRKIRAGRADRDSAQGNAKSADAKKPEPFDMSDKPTPKDGNAQAEQHSLSAAAADTCIKRSMIPASKNGGSLFIYNDCSFDVVGLGWGKGKKGRLKLIMDLPAQPPDTGASVSGKSFIIDLAPEETPDAFLAAMTFEAVKKPAFTDLCGKPNSGWADNELRCFREAHDGKSYQATRGPTLDMKSAEEMCTGEKVDRDQPTIAQKSIDACTRLLEFGIIGADGTMDREDTAFLYYYRGTTYGILKQNDKMLADLDKAILLDRDKPQFYYFRAVALAKLNRDSEAIRDSNKACEMDKQFCK
ncbi:MAG: tetratricopeptide repeat protein [Hyphomicrobiaceae bacterium]|nr:tetratricopeptide repeat protein [Hyphomicrobiaceae bacterium]